MQKKCNRCPRRFHRKCLNTSICHTCDADQLPSIIRPLISTSSTGKLTQVVLQQQSNLYKPQPICKSPREQRHQPKYSGSDFVLLPLSKVVKRCQGCRIQFDREPIPEFGVPMVIRRFENNPFYKRENGCFKDSWRNYYYHVDRHCISHFGGTLQIDDTISMNAARRKLISGLGFPL